MALITLEPNDPQSTLILGRTLPASTSGSKPSFLQSKSSYISGLLPSSQTHEQTLSRWAWTRLADMLGEWKDLESKNQVTNLVDMEFEQKCASLPDTPPNPFPEGWLAFQHQWRWNDSSQNISSSQHRFTICRACRHFLTFALKYLLATPVYSNWDLKLNSRTAHLRVLGTQPISNRWPLGAANGIREPTYTIQYWDVTIPLLQILLLVFHISFFPHKLHFQVSHQTTRDRIYWCTMSQNLYKS